MDRYRGPPHRGPGPQTGQTLTGMVKSYNWKGFGFIMCQSMDQDIYFSRESLHPKLQTSDLAGESVTFEVHRFPDGKLQARNLRPVGDVSAFQGSSRGGSFKGGKGAGSKGAVGRDGEEDRSRDWHCPGCSERNFVKRLECFKCKAPRPRTDTEGHAAPAPARRSMLSPHAGSRAMRERLLARRGGKASRSRSRKRRRRSSSGSGRARRRDASRRSPRRRRSPQGRPRSRSGGRRRKSPSRSASGASSSSEAEGKAGGSSSSDASAGAAAAAALPEQPAAAAASPEVEKAKAEALEKLLRLREMEPKEARMKEFRALLRQWHPDKNPGRVEVATAVFQFLQKGKLLMEASE